MENRDFTTWLSTFRSSIADYKYYIDFEKVRRNVDSIKIELNLLNSLIGSNDIRQDFVKLVSRYPETLKCIPLLLAVRTAQISAVDEMGVFVYDFIKPCYDMEQYCYFMEQTGLFDLISKHLINNLYDYATGVEVGLDSNGRKNRGGHLMENLVESYLKRIPGLEYYKEMYLAEIEKRWTLDLAALSNEGKAAKRFDFVVKTPTIVYAIETNFYSGGGSKLNETARSYKMLSQEADTVDGFSFVWFTDGIGWNSAKKNLQETFDVMEHVYNISDIENGIMEVLFTI
ncbi:type II restriction endonuclease [Ruminococcaceae bacterium OttesenSCG-928-O06]|nr:type II restriction endonuclease [Ruminococcaceae bacterium OttesenSCG-928-O06]